jgi:hypothetical protein
MSTATALYLPGDDAMVVQSSNKLALRLLPLADTAATALSPQR